MTLGRPLTACLLAAAVALLGAEDAAAQPSTAAAPSPAAQASGDADKAKPRLPVLAAKGPTTRVKGKIVRSSRGRRGPVRLLIEREGNPNAKVTALVAPDEFCDQAGLSLRTGESIELEGTMLQSERPMLVTTAVIVDGKTVPVRDADGKLIAGDQGGAASGTKASLSGAKPAPSPGK